MAALTQRVIGIMGTVAAVVVASLAVTGIALADPPAGTTQRVSLATLTSAEADGPSDAPAVSVDGRLVAFASAASNLVPGDLNGVSDVFVRDTLTGQTERVSVSTVGIQGNRDSVRPSMSADGRFVAFVSSSTNLLLGVTAGTHVFVHDREIGVTERVSVTSTAAPVDRPVEHASISADGRHVIFSSRATNVDPAAADLLVDVFAHDRRTGQTELVSVGDDGRSANTSIMGAPTISGDGSLVAFATPATNLVPGIGNVAIDVFVRDRAGGTTERVSVGPDGQEDPAQSFFDRGNSTDPALSADGGVVAFASSSTVMVDDKTHRGVDIFVRDLATGVTIRASVSSTGEESAGGPFPNTPLSGGPALSADGRVVAFESTAANLVADHSRRPTLTARDVYVRDLDAGVTERVSISSAAGEANDASSRATISADGRRVAFASLARNLVTGTTNNAQDVFLHDRLGDACASTHRPSGPLSGPVHDRADGLGPAGPLAKHANCQIVAPLEP